MANDNAKERCCNECGQPYKAIKSFSAFCSVSCRMAFNNRRLQRGAILYDLFMALRFERTLANKLGVWSTLCRVALEWRNEDRAQREARRSWGDWQAWLDERPYLKAENLQGMKRGFTISQ